jgi:hypothetical protein
MGAGYKLRYCNRRRISCFANHSMCPDLRVGSLSAGTKADAPYPPGLSGLAKANLTIAVSQVASPRLDEELAARC